MGDATSGPIRLSFNLGEAYEAVDSASGSSLAAARRFTRRRARHSSPGTTTTPPTPE
jgi:DNA-binding IclR family transcriptional regulator